MLHIDKLEVTEMSMHLPIGDLVSMLKTPDEAERQITRWSNIQMTIFSFVGIVVLALTFAIRDDASWWYMPLIVMSCAIIFCAVSTVIISRRIQRLYDIERMLRKTL